MKRLCAVFIIFVLMIGCSIPLFAKTVEGLPDSVYMKETETTAQYFVNIISPTTTESVYKKEYSINGQTDYEGIGVQLLRFNFSTGMYEEYTNIDEESNWVIGSSGLLMTSVDLNDDLNLIRVVAFKKDNVGNQNAIYQINDFEVTLKKESIKDKINNGIYKAADAVNKLNDFIDGLR